MFLKESALARRLHEDGFVASRTQIICLHEGKKGRSIDPIFIRSLLKALDPAWIRPWPGNNVIRTIDCGGRSDLISKMPDQLRSCLAIGSDTTLMVWADVDDDTTDGDALKAKFWTIALQTGITKAEFDQVVFIFAKDRIENWVEFLLTGATVESREGPRQKHGRLVADAAKKLAAKCQVGAPDPQMPASLLWSCKNWRELVARMKR
jgi:hypothetical protein